MLRRVFAPAALLMLATACGEGRGAPDSSAPASVDERHGFTLASPGEGWTLLAPDEAKLLHPDALAGATSREMSAVVTVERMPPVPLERYAGRVADAIALEERSVERREPTRVGDADAFEIIVSGRRGSVDLRFGVLVAAHDDHAFRLVAWGEKRLEASDFTPVFRALALRGKPAIGSVAQTQRGVGWRIEGNQFESAALGLRVKAADGWRVLPGSADVDVVLSRSDSAGSIAVTSEPCAGKESDLVEELESAFALTLGAKAPRERFAVDLLGAKTNAAVHRDEEREYLHGVRVLDGRCLQILARHPIAESANARRALPRGVAGIAALPAPRIEALKQELGPQNLRVVGADYLIQGRSFRHFTSGLRWQVPKGSWHIGGGEAAQGVNRDALAVAENRSLGIHALLIDEAADQGAAEYHERVIRGMRTRVRFKEARRDKATLAEGAALMAEGEITVRGRALACRVITGVSVGRAMQVLVWGRPENMKAHDPEIGRLIAGIERDSALRAVERTTSAYRDHRLGFELALSAEWHHEDRTPSALAPSGSFVRWNRHGRWLGVVAVAGGPQDALVVAMIEDLLREDLGSLARGDERSEATTVAGWPARHLSWHASLQRIEAFVAHRDGVTYGLVAVDSDGEAATRLREGFAFLIEGAAP